MLKIYEQPTGTFTRYLIMFGSAGPVICGINTLIQEFHESSRVTAIFVLDVHGDTTPVTVVPEETGDDDFNVWDVVTDEGGAHPAGVLVEHVTYVDGTWDFAKHDVYVMGFNLPQAEQDEI